MEDLIQAYKNNDLKSISVMIKKYKGRVNIEDTNEIKDISVRELTCKIIEETLQEEKCKIYYKATTKKWKNRDHIFSLGINIDPYFEKSDEDFSKGFYFCESIPSLFNWLFLLKYKYIFEIKIPEDAKIVRIKNKIKADKIEVLTEPISISNFFEKLTEDEILEILEYNKYVDYKKIFKKIPKNLLTEKICEKFIKCYSGFGSSNLNHIPKTLRTEKICREAVFKYCPDIKYCPNHVLTHENIELFLRHNGYAIQYFPKKMITQHFCEIALFYSKQSCGLFYIPRKFRTYDMCIKLDFTDFFIFSLIPAEIKTYDMCKKAVEKFYSNIKYVPKKFRTEELCRIFYKLYKSTQIYSYNPKKLKTYKKYEKYVPKKIKEKMFL